jgi:peptidoglycan/xylan/chitin deacetylase (PgdA/CDA1 family)
MKNSHKLSFLVLAGMLACSSQNNVAGKKNPVFAERNIARLDVTLDDEKIVTNKIEKLIQDIFHSYLLGQVALQNFDQQLNKSPKKALSSDAYAELMVIRTLVDQFEEEVNETYLDLVLIGGADGYSPEQKDNAEKALKLLGDFMVNLRSENVYVPESLRMMVLSNLVQKQYELYDLMEALKQSEGFGQNAEMQATLHKNMVRVRATRIKYNADLSKYKIDQKELQGALATESKKPEFKKYKEHLKALSQDMKKYMSELRGGRSTSSDIIFASAGSAGNITGRGFMPNTWSLTYDDGPGAKTTSTVLKNLQDRDQKASFFVLAKQVEALPTISKSLKDAGMDMALHSYTHAQLTKVGPVQLEREIGGAKAVVESKLGVKVKLFRLPYGAGVSVASIRQKIAQHNMIHVFWNVDTLDWQDKNPTSIYNRSLKQMAAAGNKGVILFHDIHPQSVTASTMLMDYFKTNAAKTKLCTVQEVVDALNAQRASCK